MPAPTAPAPSPGHGLHHRRFRPLRSHVRVGRRVSRGGVFSRLLRQMEYLGEPYAPEPSTRRSSADSRRWWPGWPRSPGGQELSQRLLAGDAGSPRTKKLQDAACRSPLGPPSCLRRASGERLAWSPPWVGQPVPARNPHAPAPASTPSAEENDGGDAPEIPVAGGHLGGGIGVPPSPPGPRPEPGGSQTVQDGSQQIDRGSTSSGRRSPPGPGPRPDCKAHSGAEVSWPPHRAIQEEGAASLQAQTGRCPGRETSTPVFEALQNTHRKVVTNPPDPRFFGGGVDPFMRGLWKNCREIAGDVGRPVNRAPTPECKQLRGRSPSKD